MAGNIKYTGPECGYIKVGKGIINDKEVDPLSLGIFVKAISLGKNWNMNVKGFAVFTGLSEDKVRKSFSTLEKAGYLRRIRSQGDDGQFSGWEYEFCSSIFTDLAQKTTSDNPDGGETPTSVKADYLEQPTSENCQGINIKSKIKTEESIVNKDVIGNPPPSYPFPKPFLLSSEERNLAGNDPTKIAQIKRHHLQKNLEVINGELAMDNNQAKSFLDYWCSCSHDRPEMIRAEGDRYFDLKQKADSWMAREKGGGKTNAQHQSKIEQYADRNNKLNELINKVYGPKQNRSAEDCARNTPDEQ